MISESYRNERIISMCVKPNGGLLGVVNIVLIAQNPKFAVVKTVIS